MPDGLDPEAIVHRKQSNEKYMQHPITIKLLKAVDEVRQKLFSDIMLSDQIPGVNNDERINFVNLVKGRVMGISDFEALLNGEIADADALYEHIRESLKKDAQHIQSVGKLDYNNDGGYPPEEHI